MKYTIAALLQTHPDQVIIQLILIKLSSHYLGKMQVPKTFNARTEGYKSFQVAHIKYCKGAKL